MNLKRFRRFKNLQSLIIHNYNWKYLIILDGCRFDYFKSLWEYNRVYKVNSPASSTLSWLQIVFPDYYDYVIYSCNPFIGNKIHKKRRYNAIEHFKQIISLWDGHWNKEFSTVLPKTVYEYSIEHAIPKSIIWFLQPHSPYIDLDIGKTSNDFMNWSPEKDPIDWSVLNGDSRYSLEQIKELYENNLKYVIPYVYKLICFLEKPIIITSDHGESLGENGIIGHPNIKSKVLREVPMVIIR